jgi:hypothetical protein
MDASEVAEAPPVVGRRARWPRFLLLGLVLLAGLGLAYGYLLRLADRRLREAVAEADQLDPGWRLDELEAARAPIPDEENAAPRVLAAHRLLPPRNVWPEYRLDEELAQLPPTQPLGAEPLATLRAAVANAQTAVDAGRQLADYGHGRHILVWGPDLMMTLLTHVDAITLLTRFLTFDVHVRLEDGDVEGALRTCQAQFQMARSLGDEPCAVTQAVRLWRSCDVLVRVERCLARGQAAAATLETLQGLAADEASQPFALRMSRGVRALLHAALQSIEDGTAKADSLQGWYQDPRHGKVSPREFWYLRLPGALKTNHAALLKHLNQLVEIAKLPLEEQGPAYDRLADDLGNQSVLIRMLGSFPDRQGQNCQTGIGLLRCASAMLAVERFRLARGRWPETLNELVPGYLTGVPADPFDGKPLRYRRLGDGVVIYSIGPDGKDDGGNLSPALGRAEGPDLGFRLWDEAARRRPAPEDKPAK